MRLALAFALAFALIGAPAFADVVTTVTPIYGQLVAVPIPADFKADYESEQNGS